MNIRYWKQKFSYTRNGGPKNLIQHFLHPFKILWKLFWGVNEALITFFKVLREDIQNNIYKNLMVVWEISFFLLSNIVACACYTPAAISKCSV